jgi:membrane-bound lytic murein transglycosylase B
MRRRNTHVRRASVIVTVLVAIPWLAQPAAAATTTTSSTSSTSSPAPTTTAPTVPPTGAPSTTTSSTSTTVPVTVPPAGTPVSNLQLNAINAQFVAGVEAEVGAAQNGLDLARAALTKAQAADTTAVDTAATDRRRLDALDTTQRQQALAVRSARARLRDLAVAAYVSGGPGAPVEELLSSGDINEFARRQGFLSTIASEGSNALRTYSQARDASSHDALVTVDQLQRAEAARANADLVLQAAQAAVTDATTILNDRAALLTLTSDAISTPHTDIPRMVLDAYQRAALAVRTTGCNLAWWGLAGIGRVESDHGRAQNAHLAPNGDLVPHIVGVPLTGKNGTDLIQNGSGDFAHAEGPMQFIPSTWRSWGRDGNGDGVKDVDNVYDAAFGAAAYLCATSHDLETDDGLKAAYLSYNHSDAYVTEVLAYAKSYQAADAAGLIPPMTPLPLWALAPPPPPAAPAGPGVTTSTTVSGAPHPSTTSTVRQ